MHCRDTESLAAGPSTAYTVDAVRHLMPLFAQCAHKLLCKAPLTAYRVAGGLVAGYIAVDHNIMGMLCLRSEHMGKTLIGVQGSKRC